MTHPYNSQGKYVAEARDDTLFVARQPICDRDRAVIGYEILYRDGPENAARFEDADQATARVMTTTFLELGLERLVGSLPAYVNVTRAFLTGEMGLPATPEQVVIEVGECFADDGIVVEGMRRFASEGYRLVLDDFRYRAGCEPALAVAEAVKLDPGLLEADALREQVTLAHGLGLRVIAERVETEAQYELCRELGCDAFQGFFFCRPRIVSGQPMPNNRGVLFTLMARLEDPDVGVEELERLIVQDVTLSYRLLRHVNCATFSLRREVDSIRQAILLLGARLIRHWASLILLSDLGEDDARCALLMDVALVRARMCERLAGEEEQSPSQAFTVGLFSVLDALLQRPMDELLDTVAFSVPVQMALADRSGPLGALLDRVSAYEQAHWERLAGEGIPAGVYREAYLDALRWAAETRALLNDA